MPVYLIRAGIAGDVKIGVTNDPLKRLRGLQTANMAKLRLIRVLQGEGDVEKALHVRFSSGRKAGEWFSFVPEMLAADIGYPDLPIPTGKRIDAYADTPLARKRVFHEDMIQALGGVDAIARRLGVAPWIAAGFEGVRPNYYSAVALMMRDAGYRHVTVDVLLQLRSEEREYLEQEAEKRAERDAAQAAAWQEERDSRDEAEWIRKNGLASAWWELRPENRPVIPADNPTNPDTAADASEPPDEETRAA